MQGGLRLDQVAALLAVAQDHSFGQPPGSQLRATVLAQRLAEAATLDRAERDATWWVSTLRFLGCTGHAFETAADFGDEIDLRARSLQFDAGNPVDVLKEMVKRAGPGKTGVARVGPVLSLLATGKKVAADNFRAACEVADALASRLRLDSLVRDSLATNFERWNGRGLPAGVKGEAIPRPMRVAQISQEFEALSRLDGVAFALDAVRDRGGRSYDPALADLMVAGGRAWYDELADVDPWDAALEIAPTCLSLDADASRDALLVLADFADLKSPWTNGHSRAVAELVSEVAGEQAGLAALVHDLGRVAVPNTIWDKPAGLTRDEMDRVESHTLVTDQLLRRVPFTADFAAIACAAHERNDGSGYHRRLGGGQLDAIGKVIAAADAYQAMTSERPHRAALSAAAAAKELRASASRGELDAESVERVLSAAGHRRTARPSLPAGLTSREVEVLGVLARGLTTRQIADQLVISPKTADHHIQSIYSKIGVSTRGAAALFAIEKGLLAASG